MEKITVFVNDRLVYTNQPGAKVFKGIKHPHSPNYKGPPLPEETESLSGRAKMLMYAMYHYFH